MQVVACKYDELLEWRSAGVRREPGGRQAGKALPLL